MCWWYFTPKIARWPTSVVDTGFYTTWWDINKSLHIVALGATCQ